MLGLSRPCRPCADGNHPDCAEGTGGLCGCIVVHEGDSQAVRGFKILKQRACPERAAWTKGGFTPGAETTQT